MSLTHNIKETAPVAPQMIGRECKFITYLPKISGLREDTHIIKETLHYSNGELKDNLRVVSNFKRPFYITKKYNQNHKDKKESEDIDKLNEYQSTDSNLGRAVASRLGSKYNGVTDIRMVRDSPYVYGIDIPAGSIIKNMYQEKYPDAISPYKYAALDIEANVLTDEITIVSIVMIDKIHSVVTRKYLKDSHVDEDRVKKVTDHLYDKYVPNTDMKDKIVRTLDIVDNEMDLVRNVIAKAHEWGPDFLGIWNIEYDIPKMLTVCNKYGVDPADIFSDPDLPKHLRHFTYKQGMKQHVTESGKVKPINPEEQWHSVITPAKFYIIDAMSAHRYVRVGGKSTPGGYSLDNILLQELGSSYQKLRFEDNPKYKGIEWHIHMTQEKPLEYTVYNMWDSYAMIELDNKTSDLKTVLPMLAGISSFSIFNSGPKKIVEAMHYVYLEKGKVLACKPSRIEDDKLLGLDDWIILLPSYRINTKNGLKVINENCELATNVRGHTYDSDCVSSYPSDTRVANVSKDTTRKEVIDIDGLDKDVFKKQNINLFFGGVNVLEYGSTMFKFPTLREIDEEIKLQTSY